MRKILGILALSCLWTTAAFAAPSPPPTQPLSQSTLQQWDNWVDQFGEQVENWFWAITGYTDPDQGSQSGSGSGPVAAPELDPADALAALTLLAGGLAVLRGRRKAQ